MSEEPAKAEIAIIDKRAGAEEQALERVAHDNTPGALLRMALERNLDLDRIEKLMVLQERWEANEARKAYVAAMSEFKKNAPVITHDKKVSFRNSKNDLVEYTHATLAQVVALSVEGLSRHGFHHDWKADQHKDGVSVKCVITHKLGHSETTVLQGPRDTSGSKNAIQSIASTVTYLERYTLLMALGLAPAEDDDGRGSGAPEPEGKEAPPVDQDPEPDKRAQTAIRAYAKYLGKENARTDLERYLGKPAGRWEPDDFAAIKQVWDDTVKPIKDATPDEKKDALLRALRDEPDFGDTDDPPPPSDGDQQDLL